MLLHHVLHTFCCANLKLNMKKYVFAQTSVEYLGFSVSGTGIQSSPSKVQSIVNYPAPTNIDELHQFIGLVSFYLKCSKIKMYADDTSLAYSAKSVSDISNVMNYELESLRKWLSGNKLSLNVAKTTSMLIGTRNTLQDKSNGELLKTDFKISDELIEHKTSLRYFGIQIDYQLQKERACSISVVESLSSYRKN